jgi:hypothetical protein
MSGDKFIHILDTLGFNLDPSQNLIAEFIMRNRVNILTKVPPLQYSVNERYFGSGDKQEIEKVKKLIAETEKMYPSLLRLFYKYILYGILMFVFCLIIIGVIETKLKYKSDSILFYFMIFGLVWLLMMLRKGNANLKKFKEDKSNRISQLNDYINYINKTGRYSPDYQAYTGFTSSTKTSEKEKCKAGYYESDGDHCFACVHAHSCQASFKRGSAFIDPFRF